MNVASVSKAVLMCCGVAALVLCPAYAADTWRKRASAEEVVTQADILAEVAFGREISARIFGRYKAYENEDLIKYVNLVGLALVRGTNRPELDFHFMVLDTDEINAYAAPGGYIFVTKGAVLRMKDEAELAGVLAHEIGHVVEKHVVRELKIKGADDSSEGSVTQGLAYLAGGSSQSARAAFSQAVDKGLDLIVKGGYKKDDEMQADRDAAINTSLVGYDPSGLTRYLKRILDEKGEVVENPADDADHSHPTFAARLAQLSEVIRDNGINPKELTSNKPRFAKAAAAVK